MTTTVLEQCYISPTPPVPSASLPLTFFDVLWLYSSSPVERIFLYSFPDAIDVPNLKSSLALTLRHFFPLAGRVRPVPDFTDRHELHYSETDSISFTVAETSTIDFNSVTVNRKEFNKFKLLVPRIPEGSLLAIQVTVFPGHGLCIGLAVNHIACDGLITVQFIKSWASAFKSNGEIPLVGQSPLFDRSLIPDPVDLYSEFVHDISTFKDVVIDRAPSNLVHSTFTLSRDNVNRLKALVGGRASTYVVSCAYIWVCLVKARDCKPDRTVHFTFAIDWRKRMNPVIPDAYFGNCIGGCFSEAKVCDLVGGNGIIVAANAIRTAIGRLEEGMEKNMKGALKRALALYAQGPVLSVAGSTKFGVYDVDFGWGRPAKVDVPSIEASGAISLAESREGDGGVEIGIALPENEMDVLTANFENGRKVFL